MIQLKWKIMEFHIHIILVCRKCICIMHFKKTAELRKMYWICILFLVLQLWELWEECSYWVHYQPAVWRKWQQLHPILPSGFNCTSIMTGSIISFVFQCITINLKYLILLLLFRFEGSAFRDTILRPLCHLEINNCTPL